MTKTATAEAERSRKLWIRAISIISAAIVLSIGGVVYYGTIVLPAQNAARDVAACKIYVKGSNDAAVAFMKEGSATDHKPSVTTAINNYMKILFTANNLSYNQANPNGSVAASFIQISKARLALDTSSSTALMSGFNSVYSAASDTLSLCQSVLTAAHVPVPTLAPATTPSSSPSSTK